MAAFADAIRGGVFLPTPSARRATQHPGDVAVNVSLFLPTPSARRATAVGSCKFATPLISTHALREEGDQPTLKPPCRR